MARFTFETYYRQFLDDSSFQRLVDCLKKPVRTALRINTGLFSKVEFLQFAEKEALDIDPVPWCESGFFLNSPKAAVTKCKEFEEAMYYLQDASSMLPSQLLNPDVDDVVLDMCAAPGGKTIHLANLMKNRGLLIANEAVTSRHTVLKIQLEKYGVANSAITPYDSSFFAKNMPNYFDKILVDAPCSGEGMRERGESIMENFSYNLICFNAKRQRRILDNAFRVLKPGGTLVYSTCALSYDENELVADFLLKKYPEAARLEDTGFPELAGITKDNSLMSRCVRFWPFSYNTNGFFVAKIGKLLPTEATAEKKNFQKDKKVTWGQPVWQKLSKKERLRVAKALSIPDYFEIMCFRDEIWLQPGLLSTLPIPYLKYAGIRIASMDRQQKIIPVISERILARILR